jgi:hypothetical protein
MRIYNGGSRNILIPNVLIFCIHSENGASENFAVSKSVLGINEIPDELKN